MSNQPPDDQWQILAQWGPRTGGPEDLWRDLVAFAAAAETAFPAIEDWQDDKGRSLGSALEDRCLEFWQDFGTPPPGHDTLSESLTASDDEMTTLYGMVDVVLGSTDRFDPNGIRWHLIEAGPAIIADQDSAHRLLSAIVTATSPDWAGLYPGNYLDLQAQIRTDGPHIGWLTYLAGDADTLPAALPEDLPGADLAYLHQGRLITAAATPDLEAIQRLAALL